MGTAKVRWQMVAAAVLVAMGPVAAQAATQVCTFEKWNGGTTDLVQSWLGTGFRVEADRSTVRMLNRDQAASPMQVRATRASDFTTYVHRATQADVSGRTFYNRIAFRVHDDGTCSARLSSDGYIPLTATGKLTG